MMALAMLPPPMKAMWSGLLSVLGVFMAVGSLIAKGGAGAEKIAARWRIVAQGAAHQPGARRRW
jgi:hypothetical protein